MSRNIEDKVIVATGASSGPGEATARHLAIGQPEDVDVNEILFRPTAQEL